MSIGAYNRILELRDKVENDLDSYENMIKYACYTECLHIVSDYIEIEEVIKVDFKKVGEE